MAVVLLACLCAFEVFSGEYLPLKAIAAAMCGPKGMSMKVFHYSTGIIFNISQNVK